MVGHFAEFAGSSCTTDLLSLDWPHSHLGRLKHTPHKKTAESHLLTYNQQTNFKKLHPVNTPIFITIMIQRSDNSAFWEVLEWKEHSNKSGQRSLSWGVMG